MDVRSAKFLNAHWGSIAAADFFTTEVWTVFLIDLASRRVQILGSTPHPEALFMQQIVRTLTMAEAGVVSRRQVLICDRDRKWSQDVRRRLRDRASGASLKTIGSRRQKIEFTTTLRRLARCPSAAIAKHSVRSGTATRVGAAGSSGRE
jgi:hypothetical protein